MDTRLKVDYSMSYSINPDWYGECLIGRVTNNILMSTLLLVVTGPYFLEPPFEDPEEGDPLFRAYFYTAGILNLLFLASTVFAICFIENGMSRGYGRSERLVLTIKQYHLKDIAQTLTIVGTIIGLPLFLALPMWNLYGNDDANTMMVITTLFSVILLGVFGKYTVQAGGEQNSRIEHFLSIVDMTDGRLLKEYYPARIHENDGITYLGPEDYKSMYEDIAGYQQVKSKGCLTNLARF